MRTSENDRADNFCEKFANEIELLSDDNKAYINDDDNATAVHYLYQEQYREYKKVKPISFP